MATDSFGNWISGFSPAATPEATSGVSQLRWGPGAPSSDLGNVGDGYVRTSNGDFYTKKDSGWELQVGGGGGGASVETGSGSPQGVVTAEVGGLYVDTTGHTLWIKETGSGNTGWAQYV